MGNILHRAWWGIKIALFVLIAALLHYVLPQHDIVKINGTDNFPVKFSQWNKPFFAQVDSGNTDTSEQRFVRLIYTEKKKTWALGFWPRSGTETMVYRNEDTGWIWPPYFKFDSSDAQAKAEGNISPKDADSEKWVVITHYGWRNYYLTIYPNIVGIRPVDGPDVTIIPWFNIFFFAFVIFAWAFMRAMWRQFRQRSLDPALEDMGESWDSVSDNVNEKRGRISRWLGTWRRKK